MARSLNDDAPLAVVAKEETSSKVDTTELAKPKDVAVEDVAEERLVNCSF